MPRKFSFPNMKLYDGTTDPDDHIAQYKQRMFTTAIPRDLREACMCKGFGSSLIGPALQWYTNLPNNSICSFAQLMDTFVEQFASSRKPERDSQHLNTVRQGNRESLREYIARFNKEKVSISNPNTETVINAFRNGLHYGSDLCKELTKFPCKNFEDVLAKAWAQIRWDEDEQYKLSTRMPVRTERESRLSPNRNEGRNFRARRMPERIYDTYGSRRTENRREIREPKKPYERRHRAEERPNLPEYNLSIEPTELVGVLKGMGEAVKWPQKMKATPGTRDTKRWCEFHRDHGHRTDECHALRLEVAELLKQGHLKDLLTERGRATRDKSSNGTGDDTPPAPPRHDKVIYVISGGSEVSGVSYAVAN
ncbi:hypothetical protein UlMin_033040 [Ulmus minor]